MWSRHPRYDEAAESEYLPWLLGCLQLFSRGQSSVFMRVIKSYVNTERPGKSLLSCQATGRQRETDVAEAATSTGKSPQTSSQSGLWPGVSARAALVAAVMTGFVILSLYLHSAAPASHHVSVVWSHGCGWPRGRGCLRWSKPTLLCVCVCMGGGHCSCKTE